MWAQRTLTIRTHQLGSVFSSVLYRTLSISQENKVLWGTLGHSAAPGWKTEAEEAVCAANFKGNENTPSVMLHCGIQTWKYLVSNYGNMKCYGIRFSSNSYLWTYWYFWQFYSQLIINHISTKWTQAVTVYVLLTLFLPCSLSETHNSYCRCCEHSVFESKAFVYLQNQLLLNEPIFVLN